MQKDDVIYRQAAIDAIKKSRFLVDAMEKVIKLPSAQPDLSSYSDKLWKNAYERGKAEAVRKGKWLHNPDDTAGEPYYICDQCGHGSYDITKFCPHCGSLNGEEGD